MILIDCGHGGIDPELGYMTGPNKMFVHSNPHFEFYEGEWNRKIGAALKRFIGIHNTNWPFKQIEYEFIADPILDTPLAVRAQTANEIFRKQSKALLLSLHFNASPNHNAKGFEIFTSPGSTYSDVVANQYYNLFMKNDYFREQKLNWRADWSDGDADREANFYMLTKTNCPSVLIEHGFFDHPEEYKFLIQDKTIDEFGWMHFEIAKWHYEKHNLWKR